MIKIKCKIKECGKVIEAYTKKQADYLLRQHCLAKHDRVQDEGK